MWLDRLSGQSTPSAPPPPAQQRSYSPAPRRSSHLAPSTAARPLYAPRTSSLGLGSKSNLSTTSLSSPRLPNGSSLKQQISHPANVTDPLEALDDVLGQWSDKVANRLGDQDGTTSVQRPPRLAEDIDFEGLSLYAFADRTSKEETKESRRLSAQTIEECEYVCPAVQFCEACF